MNLTGKFNSFCWKENDSNFDGHVSAGFVPLDRFRLGGDKREIDF